MIARVRGSHVECYGSMDLLLRDEHGEPQRIMQAFAIRPRISRNYVLSYSWTTWTLMAPRVLSAEMRNASAMSSNGRR